MWKGRLQSAIEKRSSEFSPAAVRLDDQCEFGKWLLNVPDPAIRSSASYNKCVDLHRQFHQTAAKVLDLALTGNPDAAKKAMGIGSEFGKVSASLTCTMLEWSRQAKQ